VFDPLGGLADLEARRVRFIGSPEARIAEDALRILRFFRFQALYGDPDEGPDAEGLAACAAGADGLDRLSRERVGHELRKLLGAPNPAPAVATMAQSGVLWRILPGAAATSLAPLVHLEEVYDLAPSWLRRLAALGCDVEVCTEQLRLSKEETTSLRKRAEALGDASPGPVRAYRFGVHAAQDAMLIAQSAVPAPPPAGLLDGLEAGAEQQFPLKAADLVPPLTPGRALGHALKTAEEAWVAAEFALSRDSLVALALKAGAAPPQD
ncbi:MAG: CCA tRNA nucleotidyltransferase, partial [Pseudomonadota bacterium]